jgi:hypothetical protein
MEKGCYILWPFLKLITAIWCILCLVIKRQFGTFSPVLVYCVKKNLATLTRTCHYHGTQAWDSFRWMRPEHRFKKPFIPLTADYVLQYVCTYVRISIVDIKTFVGVLFGPERTRFLRRSCTKTIQYNTIQYKNNTKQFSFYFNGSKCINVFRWMYV